MALTIKYFASLREQMGTGETIVAHAAGMTVQQAWAEATATLGKSAEWPARMLCARNLEYVDPTEVTEDGDEVAFFPPVTGG